MEAPWFAATTLRGEVSAFSHLPDDLPEEATHEREFCLRDGLKSLASIPLRIGGSILGVITFSLVLAGAVVFMTYKYIGGELGGVAAATRSLGESMQQATVQRFGG